MSKESKRSNLVSVRMKKPTYELLRDQATKEIRPISTVLDLAVNEYIKNNGEGS